MSIKLSVHTSLPRSSRGNNSELFTVNLTDTPSEAPVIVARHDDVSRVWRKCEYLVLCWRIFVNSTSRFILIIYESAFLPVRILSESAGESESPDCFYMLFRNSTTCKTAKFL